jgi:hypothetical protein
LRVDCKPKAWRVNEACLVSKPMQK